MTDEARHYIEVGREYASHDAVNHTAKEYVRGEITTNTVEDYYSIFKRGMKGVYQHVPRSTFTAIFQNLISVAQTAWRLASNDGERADIAIKGAAGKRLTYLRWRIRQILADALAQSAIDVQN
jgi:hypothetical protein